MDFAEKVASLNAEAWRRTGRRRSFFIRTFGCQMNERDSETLAGMLLEMGWHASASEDDADLVVFNTCCVRANAEQRLLGQLGAMKARKAARPDLLVAVCGCMMQEAGMAEAVLRRHRQADIVFGTFNVASFPELLWKRMTGGTRAVELLEDGAGLGEGLPVDRRDPYRAWVTIMQGCDNFCSYCIVPYVRGRERSRRPEDILKETAGLAEAGCREITLLGQNVNSYGRGLPGAPTFAGLLRAIDAQEPGIPRVRFMTSHPRDLSDDLIAAMAECPSVCPQLHLPLQSGSSAVLARMNRGYSKEDYLALVAKVRAAIPGVGLSTDVIVGFPGEREADFVETLDMMRRVRFDSAYTFLYSPREGTPAAPDPDRVPGHVASERFERLTSLQDGISREANEAYVGTTQEVLAEGPAPKGEDVWTGRTPTGRIVNFRAADDPSGRFLGICVTGARTWSLDGEIAGPGPV
jgi:tRNA-2-methylthio-N6-dimethylallyladenosine synthase